MMGGALFRGFYFGIILGGTLAQFAIQYVERSRRKQLEFHIKVYELFKELGDE